MMKPAIWKIPRLVRKWIRRQANAWQRHRMFRRHQPCRTTLEMKKIQRHREPRKIQKIQRLQKNRILRKIQRHQKNQTLRRLQRHQKNQTLRKIQGHQKNQILRKIQRHRMYREIQTNRKVRIARIPANPIPLIRFRHRIPIRQILPMTGKIQRPIRFREVRSTIHRRSAKQKKQPVRPNQKLQSVIQN